MPPVARTTAFAGNSTKPAPFTLVPERACDAAIAFQQREDCTLHMNFHAEVDAVVLQRADHFQTGGSPTCASRG